MRATGGDRFGASDQERAERRRAELLSPEGVRVASPLAAKISKAGRVTPRAEAPPSPRKRQPARGLRKCLVVRPVVASSCATACACAVLIYGFESPEANVTYGITGL